MAGKHRSDFPTAVAIMRNGTIDLAGARKLLVEIERARSNRKTRLRALAQAVAVEIAIAEAELQSAEPNAPEKTGNSFFRLQSDRWPRTPEELSALVPFRIGNLRVLRFDYDVAEFRVAQSLADFLPPRRRAQAIWSCSAQRRIASRCSLIRRRRDF